MTEIHIHKAGRIDQIVRDYFLHVTETKVLAKDLMPLFIEKGIFKNDHRNGLPIRNFLRKLDTEGKLDLLMHVRVIRNTKNRNWYFEKLS